MWLAERPHDLKLTAPSGVQLVISDAHSGLRNAIEAILIGAAWQRCRVHYADVRIMPTWAVSALAAGVAGLLKSA
jgi:transposase-like protein